MRIPLDPVMGLRALSTAPAAAHQVPLGCAPCKARELQEKSEREFKERFGHIKLIPAHLWPPRG